MVYRMIFNQTAYFGRGAIKEIPAVAKQHGFTKAFIVTDPVLLETGTAEKVDGNDSWFVGMAPADDPRVVVALIIEDGEEGVGAQKAQNVLKTALEVQGLL